MKLIRNLKLRGRKNFKLKIWSKKKYNNEKILWFLFLIFYYVIIIIKIYQKNQDKSYIVYPANPWLVEEVPRLWYCFYTFYPKFELKFVFFCDKI